MVYTDFTELRFLTLHSFSILGNVNEVKKKARRGIDKKEIKNYEKISCSSFNWSYDHGAYRMRGIRSRF